MKLMAAAIVISAALIAAAIFLTNRYTLDNHGEGLVAWRIDQLTGETRLCIFGQKARTCFLVGDEQHQRPLTDEELEGLARKVRPNAVPE